MVVLKPTLEGERMLTCKCGHIGLGSPIRERTSFYLRGGGDGLLFEAYRYRHNCRHCNCKVGTERWLRIKDDSHFKVRHRENSRRYRERQKQGKWTLPPEHTESCYRPSGVFLPSEPVAAWIEHLVTQETARLVAEDKLATTSFSQRTIEQQAIRAVRKRLGNVTARRLYSFRIHERPTIDVLTVDKLVTNHDSISIEELYRYYGDGYYIILAEDWTPLKVYQWKPA